MHRLNLLKIIFAPPKRHTHLLTAQDANGNTLLHLENTEAVTQFFLEEVHGIESLYAIKNNFGESVLHKAIRADNMLLFRAILASKACHAALLALQDNQQQTILHLAVRSQQPLFLQEILSSPHCHAALLEVRDMFGTNCLKLALDENNLDYFKIILQSPHLTQKMLCSQDPKQLNILNAIIYSNGTTVEKLAYLHSVLNCPYAHAVMHPTVSGFSPLYVAVHEKEAEIVQVLLSTRHCTTDLLKRQEVHDSELTPLLALLMRNPGQSALVEMFLQSPLCTLDVLKMKWWQGISCLRSLQEHDDWEQFKPYVEQKNQAFLESQRFLNIEVPTADADFIETVNSLKNLMYTVFEPLDDLLIPAFQQAMAQYNRDQDINGFIQKCGQALTAAELELKHNRNSLDMDSSESSSVEELINEVDASEASSTSGDSSDSDRWDDSETGDKDTMNPLARITQIRNQLHRYEDESLLLKKVKTATLNYLSWTATHAQGHRFVTRFSHFFHGSSGQARAQRILNLIDDGVGYRALKPHLEKVMQESGHRKHSYNRYLHAGMHNLPHVDIFELSNEDFLHLKYKLK